jgi:hypothetical protein
MPYCFCGSVPCHGQIPKKALSDKSAEAVSAFTRLTAGARDTLSDIRRLAALFPDPESLFASIIRVRFAFGFRYCRCFRRRAVPESTASLSDEMQDLQVVVSYDEIKSVTVLNWQVAENGTWSVEQNIEVWSGE